MRRLSPILLAFTLPLLAQGPHVTIATAYGSIELALEAGKAPESTANFLRYLDAGAYRGGGFHRTVRLDNQPGNAVKIEVIQGGSLREDRDFPPIALERTRDTGLRHEDGAVSMARAAPDSATSDFFICVGAQPELDFAGKRNPDGQGFAVFGKVVKGMDVVRRIQALPAKGQTLTPVVPFLSVQRLPGPKKE